eukprot:COSAG05_NODE_2453_length_3046_cov_5.297930_4_plen_61_part_00
MTGFTVETEIYYLLAMERYGRYGPRSGQISSCVQLYNVRSGPSDRTHSPVEPIIHRDLIS